MRSPQDQLTADDVIGGFELLRRIGKGGMAEVWIARRARARTSKYVAIKVIAPHLVGQERYSRMFQAEAELSAMLNHSNIVQVFDEGEDNGISYLVMEWVDGINLVRLREALNLVDDDDLRCSIIAHVMGQLLHALSYAHSVTTTEGHELGIVHRDVSPQNVLISNSGDLKLTDFGIAHTVIEESSHLHVKGKLRYMSPEQLAGKTKEPTIDLYAAGAILHELLEGEKFRGDFEDERVMHAQVLGGVVPSLSRPCPPALDQVRLGLLEPDSKKRYQSAREALTALRSFAGYQDMRMELSKICGSLTGVARPRTGPGIAGRGSPGRMTPAPATSQASVARPPSGPMDASGQPTAPTTALPFDGNRPPTPAPDPTMLLPDSGALGPAGPPTEGTMYLQDGGLPSHVARQDSANPGRVEEPTATSASARAMGPPTDSWVHPGSEAEGTSTRFVTAQRRSPVALIAALGVLALIGGGVTAWLLVSGLEPDDPSALAADRTAEGPGDARETPVAVGKPAVAAPDPAPEDAEKPVIPGPDAEATAEPEPTEAPPPETPEEPAADPAADPKPAETPTTAATTPKKPRPRPSTTPKKEEAHGRPVPLYFKLDGIEAAWVKVGGKVVKVRAGATAVVKSGRWKVYWKKSESASWRSVGTKAFGEGKEWLIKVGPGGPKVSEFKR